MAVPRERARAVLLATARLGLVLVCIALAGCGGGSGGGTSTRETSAQAVQRVHFATGLRHWGLNMRAAMNGISAMFARPADVRDIEAGAPRTHALLQRYEDTLVACSVGVRQLGTAPPVLVLARLEALHACKSLELAGRLVRVGVREVGGGQGFDTLDRASTVLATADDGVRRALLDLTPVR
jgi:hypothetical protein